jgi:tRNA A-37 threonylcarbamoyl transferase component Bud32
MCHYGDEEIGILVMKEYNLGSIDNYIWNENNFQLLKNVIKQVIFSIIYAYNKKGFIHGDLHTCNVLLKQKRNCVINYENITLNLNDLEVVVMDFEKSKLQQKNKITDLIKNILKFITSIISTCLKNDLIINIDIDKIIKLKSIFNDNINYYNELDNIINKINLN